MQNEKSTTLFTVSGNKLTAFTGLSLILVLFLFLYAAFVFLGTESLSIPHKIIYILICLAFVAIAGFFAYRNLSLGFARVSVDKDGVCYTSPFRRKFLPWSSIADFGILAGIPIGKHTRKRYYDLYFSEKKIPNKDERLRLFELKPVMLTIKPQDRNTVFRRILTYVQKETGIKPFVPNSFFSS